MSADLPADQRPDIEEDCVEASRAPLLSHLTELRSRLIWSFGALVVAAIACFVFAEDIFNVLVTPFVTAYERYSDGVTPNLIFTAPLEFFFVKLRVALFAGFYIAFPIIAWQLYAFIAPGLYRNEKHVFLPFLLLTPVLFTAGILFVHLLMMPAVMEFSASQQQLGETAAVNIEAQLKVSEYLSLAIALMIAFGLSFQLPVVLSLMGRVGLIGTATLRKGRKYAVVAILAAAAFLTPPDPLSQMMLAIPVYALYEVSIWIVGVFERRAKEETV
ncbi:MAG: twin-arginine translocase subunit TatC [Pseudomonadota bacterium]